MFDLQTSLERARRRVGENPRGAARAPRSDRGVSRLDPRVLAAVADALSTQEKPRTRDLLRRVAEVCRGHGVTPPSRATVYKLMAALPGPSWRYGDLPEAAQAALYNLAPPCDVPARQVAFCCFNYGDLRAASFAAGLPWLALWQALRTPGWRVKSRGLAEAVALVRGI